MELDASVQDFAEQNIPLAKQLANRIGKLTALHQQTIRQAEYRAAKLSQVWSQILSVMFLLLLFFHFWLVGLVWLVGWFFNVMPGSHW